MQEQIMENVEFSFNPEFKIMEAGQEPDGKKWLKIGGTALTEGMSLNKNDYSFENLQENDGREFKWLVGHPVEAEGHVVGKGVLKLDQSDLKHEGKIRNTANHPGIVEDVADGFYGPSIHAVAEKVTRKDGKYKIEGLRINGVGLVAFEGVKQASIDYAIAESFDRKLSELNESSANEGENNNDKGDRTMEKEKIVESLIEMNESLEKGELMKKTESELALMKEYEEKLVEAKKVKEEEDKPEPKKEDEDEPEKKEESEQLSKIQEQLDEMRKEKVEGIVESILKVNKELKKEDLMKESEKDLQRIKEYEEKIASMKPKSVGIVEFESEKGDKVKLAESNGMITVAEQSLKDFNEELMKRVR